jgi:transcriptional regulatory protein LevR
LKIKYEADQKLRNNSLKEYQNAKKILKNLQSSFELDSEDIDAFKKLETFIEKVFNNNNKC